MRLTALVVFVLSACGTCAEASDRSWPTLEESHFSEDTQRGRREDKPGISDDIRAEVAECRAAGPLVRCIGMILDSYNYFDRATTEEALLLAEQSLPVDQVVIAGDRRLPEGATAEGLLRLKQIADISENIHQASDIRSIRRRLAFDTALWQAGADFGGWGPTTTHLTALSGDDRRWLGRVQQLAIVADLDRGPFPLHQQQTDWAQEAYDLIGPSAATNLAIVKLRAGEIIAAETLARAGHADMVGRFGEYDHHTLAAAAVLSAALSAAGSGEQAERFARLVLDRRRQDPRTPRPELADALIADAEFHQGAEREKLLEEARSVLQVALASPVSPAFVRYLEVDAQLMGQVLSPSNFAQYQGMTRAYGREQISLRLSTTSLALAEAVLSKDPVRAEALAKDAGKGTLSRRAATIRALAIVLQGQSVVFSRTGYDSVPSMLNMGDPIHYPPSHDDVLMHNYASAIYYLLAAPGRAPPFARAISAGVNTRIADMSRAGGSSEGLQNWRSVFRFQVMTNWIAAHH